jgi:hypothetical protein
MTLVAINIAATARARALVKQAPRLHKFDYHRNHGEDASGPGGLPKPHLLRQTINNPLIPEDAGCQITQYDTSPRASVLRTGYRAKGATR